MAHKQRQGTVRKMPQNNMKGTQKTQKTKQFSARTTHSRSASYGRNLNKLGRITSSEDVLLQQRPQLNRSRSTESTLARRNRSFTKLTSLHPLTRTRSHQHVPRTTSRVVIDLHTANSSEDENDDQVEEEEVDTFSDEELDVDEHEERQQEPSPKLQPLSYRAPPQFSHKNASPSSQNTPKKSLIDSDQLAKATAEMSLNDDKEVSVPSNKTQDQAVIDAQKGPSEQELAQYYQNMILSQSTGLVRQFSDIPPFHNSLLPEGLAHVKQQDQQQQQQFLQYIHSNDHISGTISNGKPMSESTNSLKQFTIQPLAQSHESGSMLSFKAEPVRRDQLKMTSLPPSSAQQQRDSPLGTPNFSQFIRSGPSNIETRTQQKLWLQRENSMFDLSMLKNNNNVVTPQVRREFERVSREFVNVKRFQNPLNDAVKRLNVHAPKPHRKRSNESSSTPSTAEVIQHLKADQIQAKLIKLWIQADHHTPTIQTRPQPQRPQSQQTFNVPQQQRPTLQQNQSAYAGMMNNNQSALRSPVAPTTRAVDRANNSPENKRIDLAAMRHAEDQVQKLS